MWQEIIMIAGACTATSLLWWVFGPRQADFIAFESDDGSGGWEQEAPTDPLPVYPWGPPGLAVGWPRSADLPRDVLDRVGV